MPVTFPPEDVPDGELLSGLPLPDIRGTVGTFYYFATDLSRYEEGNTEMGGILKRLAFEGDTARSELAGPPKPDRAGADGRPAEEGRRADRGRPGADGGARSAARRPDPVHRSLEPPAPERDHRHPGHDRARWTKAQWSKWVPLEFRVNFLVRLYGMAQFYLVRAERRAAALRVARQLAARRAGDADFVAGGACRSSSTSASARTARSAGPRRRGR